MKKLITAAAFLAASSALASAATVTSQTVISSTSVTGGSYKGVSFTVSSDLLAESYLLDSLTIFGRYGSWEDGNTISGNEYFVVYSVSGTSTLTYLGGVETTSENQRFYDSTNGYYTRNTMTGSFSGITVESDSTYVVLFTTSENYANNETTFKTATALSNISSLLSSENLFATSTNTVASGPTGTFYNADGPTSAGYTPVISLTLSTIPEPSAFGLLAGVGALALVAARRRRSRAK